MKLFKAWAQEKKAPPKRARGFGGNKRVPFPASSTIPSLAFGSRGNGLGLFPVIASSGALWKSGGTIEGDHGGAPSPVDWGSLYQAEGGSQMMKIAFVLA